MMKLSQQEVTETSIQTIQVRLAWKQNSRSPVVISINPFTKTFTFFQNPAYLSKEDLELIGKVIDEVVKCNNQLAALAAK